MAATTHTPRTAQVVLSLAARIAAGNTYTEGATTAVRGSDGVALTYPQ